MDPYYAQQQSAYAGADHANAGPSGYPSAGSSFSAHRPANAYEYDVGAAAQQSAYIPGAVVGKPGGSGDVVPRGGKRTTVLKKGAGKLWEDRTLLEWDPAWLRLFVGDLSNDVSDDVLTSAFNKYPSFTKAKVVRDRLSQKAKFGFVAFSDPEDFLKAWKEMDGKYVGNRPVKLKRADTAVRAVEIGHRKAKQLDQDRKGKGSRRVNPY